MPNHWHGKYHDRKIEEDMDDSDGCAVGFAFDTMPLDCSSDVPRLVDRNTGEDLGEESGKAKTAHQPYHSIARQAKLVGYSEDADVEEKNRELYTSDCDDPDGEIGKDDLVRLLALASTHTQVMEIRILSPR